MRQVRFGEKATMANLEVLNLHDHAGLRIAAPDAAQRHFVPLVTSEFESAAARFPILFSKNAETGAFYAGAMLGFKPGENLVRDTPDGGAADRLSEIVREGFYVTDDSVVIDRAQARFAGAAGQPLFEDGQPTPALRRIQRALTQLHVGVPRTTLFLARLLELKLVEPIDLSFSFDDGERLVLEGLYTISRDALAELDDAAVLALFRQGELAQVHAVIASLEHVARLAHLRNDRLAAG